MTQSKSPKKKPNKKKPNKKIPNKKTPNKHIPSKKTLPIINPKEEVSTLLQAKIPTPVISSNKIQNTFVSKILATKKKK